MARIGEESGAQASSIRRAGVAGFVGATMERYEYFAPETYRRGFHAELRPGKAIAAGWQSARDRVARYGRAARGSPESQVREERREETLQKEEEWSASS